VLLTLLPDRRAQSLLVRRALLQEGRKDLPIAGFREHILINHASEDVAHELAPTDASPGRLVIDGWEIVGAHAPGEDETVLRKLRYDAFYGTPLDHLLRLWTIDTPVICGTVADICVHYTAASAALRWYNIVIPRDAISALDPFDLESSLRQAVFLFAGRVTTAAGLRI
jgi:nicotinamidase-related amidase